VNIAYLLLGSNIGNREKHLSDAIKLIELRLGKIIAKSSVHNTAPWGNENQDYFLNQAICVETLYSAHELLENILIIEKILGRERKKKWEPRIIDIDILFFNSEIIVEDNLIVPHPYLHKRKFALVCLAEIAGDFIHPVLKKNILQLLNDIN
jgi:2-amino-4-hydroxy-6-hydroxymethyldihydropteridine diphosphokinase